MKVEFNGITLEPKEYKIDSSSWFPSNEFEGVAPFESLINVFKSGDGSVVLEGTLKLSINLPCDRCGKSFDEDVYNNFVYILKNETDSSLTVQEMECTEEEINTLYLQEPIVDVCSVLREQFYLNIPESRGCDGDCKGLCLVCGSVITSEDCDCEPDLSGSPFAVLGKLKK